jgi:hypothetical protein
MASGQHTEPAATSKESKDAREILTDSNDASTHTLHDYGAREQGQGLQGEWTMYPFEDIREDIGKNGLQALNLCSRCMGPAFIGVDRSILCISWTNMRHF